MDDAIDILIISILFVLLIALGILCIVAPTVPYNDSFRLCAVGGAIIGLLGYRYLKS